MRKGFLYIFLTLLSFSLFAKDQEVVSRIRTWQIGEAMVRVDILQPDTSYVNLPMRTVVNDYSIANSYNGNLVSPIQSKLYFDRQEKIDFLFGRAYEPYILTARDVHFFNTTTPYSYVSYKKGFKKYREENDLDFGFTGNLNRRINLGVTLNYLNAVGHYDSQAGKRFNGSVFGSYNGDHYSFQGGVAFNTLTNFENGGIANTSETNYLNSILEREDYPTRLQAMSAYRYITGFFNHYYSICVERERQVTEDSVAIDYIPVTTFEHTFMVNQSAKKYQEKQAYQGFYPNTYFDSTQAKDTAEMLTIENVLAVTFEEEFNKWLRFGATVYAKNAFERYTTASPSGASFLPNEAFGAHSNAWDDLSFLKLPNDTGTYQYWTNNTYIGASIYKKTGRYVRYNVDGDVCLAGYKLGEFAVKGNVSGSFHLGKDTMTIQADAYIRNEQPNYFLQHYVSKHYCWDNDFQKPYRMYVSGMVEYPTQWVVPRVRVSFENILHHIYFDRAGLPQQDAGNIQVLAVDVDLNLRTPWIAWDNKVVYQHSSSAMMPLPMVALYSNLYYYDWWARNALYVQIGADVHYNTAYYAPILNPATGQFCIQQEQKVGNYPIANLYANFYVKSIRLRLFAQWLHFNDVFVKNKTYYSMPDYPYNGSTFRAGLAWSFYK